MKVFLDTNIFMEYVSCRKQYETILNIIDGEPTTQTCSCCGHRYVKEEKLSIGNREFKCVKCGFTDDRDANASKNIYKIA